MPGKISIKLVLGILLSLFYISLVLASRPENIIIQYIIHVCFLAFYTVSFVLQGKKITINPAIIAYLIFFGYAVLSALWSISASNSLWISLKLLVVAYTIIAVYNCFKNYDLEGFLLYSIIISLLINLVLIIPPFSDWFSSYHLGRFNGSASNANHLAIYTLCGICVFIIKALHVKRKKTMQLYISFILLSDLLILLSGSKKAILVTAVVSLYFFLVLMKRGNTKRVFVYGIALFFIGYIFAGNFIVDKLLLTKSRFELTSESLSSGQGDSSTESRIYYIKLGMQKFKEKPIFGHGLNTFTTWTEKYSHNNFIELLSTLGLIGVFLFYRFHYVLLKKIDGLTFSSVKTFMFLVVILFFVMDIGLVSYYYKTVLILFIYIYYIAEKESKVKEGHEEQQHEEQQ
ncbi:MAG: O-antigen ligase family protein [Bacteroidota bacterium]